MAESPCSSSMGCWLTIRHDQQRKGKDEEDSIATIIAGKELKILHEETVFLQPGHSNHNVLVLSTQATERQWHYLTVSRPTTDEEWNLFDRALVKVHGGGCFVSWQLTKMSLNLTHLLATVNANIFSVRKQGRAHAK
eukprot:scaffold60433_cov21-Tisochrysis_lutea.AAC.1